MKQLKDIVLERLILSKTKKHLSEEDLLKTKKGNKLGTFIIHPETNEEIYLEYYSLTVNGNEVAFLEDWQDADDFGDRWQSIIIPDELAESLDLEEDGDTGGFIVPENIKNHIMNIFEFDDDENIDIMGVSLWFSIRSDETYYGSNKQYASFIKKIHDNL
jgi:hypothetical protein